MRAEREEGNRGGKLIIPLPSHKVLLPCCEPSPLPPRLPPSITAPAAASHRLSVWPMRAHSPGPGA